MTSCVWHSIKMVVALGALIGCFTQTALADARVATLGVRSQDAEDELERRLSSALRTTAKAIGDLTVADREQSLDQMLLAHGCDEPDTRCLSEIAKALTVEQLLYGTISNGGGTYEMTLYSFDASSGRTEQQTARGISADLVSPANAPSTVEKILRRLLGKDAPPAPVTGRLRIESGIPGTEMLIDGQSAGFIDDQGLLMVDLPAGRHEIKPSSAEYSPSDERIATVEPGQQVVLSLAPVTALPVEDEVPPALDQPPAPTQHAPTHLRRNIGYATLGVGVAFAIATIYSWVRIDHINGDHSFKEYRSAFPKAGSQGGVKNVCVPASHGELAAQGGGDRVETLERKANDLCKEADKLETLQWVFLGGTVLSAGVGTYLVLTGREKHRTETTLRVQPRLSAQSSGLAATLTF